MTTLLEEFIIKKNSEYDEPTRKGTPKGEKVGFSALKYHATLLALTNDRVKDQAERLHVKYPVLLTWRSQDDFKQLLSQHIDEFTSLVIKTLLAKGFQEDRFSDAPEYSDDLLKSDGPRCWQPITFDI